MTEEPPSPAAAAPLDSVGQALAILAGLGMIAVALARPSSGFGPATLAVLVLATLVWVGAWAAATAYVNRVAGAALATLIAVTFVLLVQYAWSLLIPAIVVNAAAKAVPSRPRIVAALMAIVLAVGMMLNA